MTCGVLFGGDQENLAMAFLEKHAPEVRREIAALRDADAEGYRISVAEAAAAAREHGRLLELGDRPAAAAYLKMYQIDFDAVAVADEIVASEDEREIERLEEELRELVDASFEQWAIVERARVERLEREVAALRGDFEEAMANRKDVVRRDCQALLDETRAFRKRGGE